MKEIKAMDVLHRWQNNSLIVAMIACAVIMALWLVDKGESPYAMLAEGVAFFAMMGYFLYGLVIDTVKAFGEVVKEEINRPK